MRYTFFLLIMLNTSLIVAQNTLKQSLNELVQSERNFAQHAYDFSTKSAFLSFSAKSAVVFTDKPVKVEEVWVKRPEDKTALLSWKPVFAEIAKSGDFGYTTGPWTYQASRDSAIIACGYYNSVWQKQNDGSWKFLIDFGNSFEKSQMSEEKEHFKHPKKSKNPQTERENILVEMDGLLAETINENDISTAFEKFFSAKVRCYRVGSAPFLGKKKIPENHKQGKLQFELHGTNIAQSGDLGYTYGQYTWSYLDKTSVGNFMHIWKKEHKGWKIVLDIMIPN